MLSSFEEIARAFTESPTSSYKDGRYKPLRENQPRTLAEKKYDKESPKT